ncbi:MAG TPA: NADH-ubiquinone oxidoreductase-F iron-sulfur binding region domain-containing protein [Actinoplanes sp.]|nr:NADH-ubiquinone oxidoreductase-F iron-sulfur binding region domain-containing protein [Actinoplanes sp.]
MTPAPATGAPPRPGRLLDGAVRYRSQDRRLISGPQPDDLAAHLDRYGARQRRQALDPDALLEAFDAVALTGRGGGHYPVAAKWRTVLHAGGGGYVVANGAEGEPASAKDAALLQHRPHLVLDGLAVAAEVLHAEVSVIWLHAGAAESVRAVTRALAERRAAGLVEPVVRVLTGPDHYLTGEAGAVLNGIAGRPAVPSFRLAPAARTGLHDRPTLVQNVETLARVALLSRRGPRADQPGPLLSVAAGGLLTVCEPPPHTSLGRVLTETDAVDPHGPAPQAVLLGGYGGTWQAWAQVAGLPLANLGAAMLGAGIVAPLAADDCGLTRTAAMLDHLARSSAGQCGPCVFGTRDLADTMARVAAGRPRRGDERRLGQLTGEISGRGACALPDGAARLAASAVQVFGADLREHLRRRPCRRPSGGAAAQLPGLQP